MRLRVLRSLALPARLAILAAVARPAAAAAQQPPQKVDLRHAVAPDVSVRLGGPFATLRITGWDKDTVAVTGTLPRDARLQAAYGSASPTTRGMKMFVEAPEGTEETGALELHVPARARVWAKTGSAIITVTGVSGGLDLNVIGGSVRVSGAPRELNVESMDGSVTVDGPAEWMRVKTATGDIVLRGGSDDLGATTVSGTIRVEGGRYERARFEAVTGGVVFAGDAARGASLSFDTHSGPIELRIAPHADIDVDAVTVTGTIENTIGPRKAVAGREGRGQELGFSSGTGDARIVIRSFKGKIRLTTR